MTIVLVNRYFHPDHSATSQLLSDLAFHLAGEGWSVCVVTGRQRIDDARAGLPAREQVRGVDVHRVWTTCFGRGHLGGRALDYATFYLSAGLRLARLCRRGDVLVAKTDPPLISVIAEWVCRLRGTAQVNWLHDLFPEIAQVLGVRGLQGSLGRGLRRLRNRSLARARMNVVLGERMAARVRAEGICARRVRVIHNWADGARIRPLARRSSALAREWGLARRFVVAYSGNMGRVHDFEGVLDAAAALRDADDAVFLFVGGGRQREALEAEAHRRGLGNVQFRPYQPGTRLAESLAAGDVHLVSLLPALEGLVVPSKLYGIAAAGRPCVFLGAADGEVAMILSRERCGVTVPPGDGAALASVLRALRRDPARRRAMGRRARAAFERSFSRERALAAWREVLLAAGGGAGR